MRRVSGAGFWTHGGGAAKVLSNLADGAVLRDALWGATSKKVQKVPFLRYTWEDTHLQADLTMGNLASALAIQSEEAALIQELQAGSEEAFAWLITRYHQPIYSLLARTVQDRNEAADLTQEVFVKKFRGVGGFNGHSSLRTWIYRIALREASNSRRWWMRHKQQEVPIDQEMAESQPGTPVLLKDMLVDPAESPFDAVIHEENRVRVEKALSQVPEPFRTTLILRDVEGFLYEEVAEMQGVNLGTVKSRLVRGRACLKTLLMTPANASSQVLQRLEMPLGEEAR
jgi:RNA polymerase sigma-70 factor (ECF subfamily)